MKKLSFIFVACLLFIGCNSKPERYTTTAPEIETVKSGIEAYLNADWENWVTQYADTARIFHNDWDKYRDVETVVEGHKSMLSYFESYGFEDGRTFYEMVIDDEGKKWVYFWGIWRGKVKETGRELAIPVHLAKQFKEGKNVEEYGFWNLSEMLEAIQESEDAASEELETIAES